MNSTEDTAPPAQAPAAAPETTAAPETATEVDKLKAEVSVAQLEVAELRDKFLRSVAEMENIRRRAELDVAAAHKYAIERFATEIIAVRDSLDLASTVELADSPEAIQKMYEGLELTLKLLDGAFEKFGIVIVNPKGERFDPAWHQAISTVESKETPPNHVVNVVQKGYLLRDRVLRPAMVVVSKEPAKE
jgi:molecular chaperone GrpE